MTAVRARAVPPGEVLLAELEASGWTQKDLAAVMDRPAQMINEISRGTKQITADTALQLESALGVPADAWLQLEARYRVALARERQSGQAIERRAHLYSLLPVAEVQRRGWIPPASSLDDLETAVCRFLGISRIDEEPATAVSLRVSPARGPDTGAMRAWRMRAEQLARENPGVPEPDLERLVPALLEVATDSAQVHLVPEVMHTHGVQLILLPHLPKTFLDGAAFWVNGAGPVVALSLRYDRIDNFWFTLLHEIEHLRRGDMEILEELVMVSDTDSPTEAAVNAAAADTLVPQAALTTFLDATNQRPSRDHILAFAARIQRHAGIVVGRLQRIGVLGYQEHRGLLVPVRPQLSEYIAA